MKKLFLVTVLLAGIVSACSNNSPNEGNTHKHDDGSIHADHADTISAPTQQEEFSADSASADTASQATPHTHDGSEEHSH